MDKHDEKGREQLDNKSDEMLAEHLARNISGGDIDKFMRPLLYFPIVLLAFEVIVCINIPDWVFAKAKQLYGYEMPSFSWLLILALSGIGCWLINRSIGIKEINRQYSIFERASYFKKVLKNWDELVDWSKDLLSK